MEVTDEAIHNIEDKLIDHVDRILDFVVYVGKTSKKETAKVTINKFLPELLGHKSKQIVAKSAKAIAEIAKTHQGRKKCTTIELIWALIDLLKKDDIDILTQACSALGNICDMNENGKNLVREQDGLKVILTVLKKGIASDNVEDASFLRIEATEFLYNFLKGQEALCMKVLEEDILPIICSILEKDGFINGQAAINVLFILNMFNKQNIVFLNERLTSFLVDILNRDIFLNGLSMRCLQIFFDQAKDEKAKQLLYDAEVDEVLEKLDEQHGPQRMYETSIYVEIRKFIEGNPSRVTDSDDDLSRSGEDFDDDLDYVRSTDDDDDDDDL